MNTKNIGMLMILLSIVGFVILFWKPVIFFQNVWMGEGIIRTIISIIILSITLITGIVLSIKTINQNDK